MKLRLCEFSGVDGRHGQHSLCQVAGEREVAALPTACAAYEVMWLVGGRGSVPLTAPETKRRDPLQQKGGYVHRKEREHIIARQPSRTHESLVT